MDTHTFWDFVGCGQEAGRPGTSWMSDRSPRWPLPLASLCRRCPASRGTGRGALFLVCPAWGLPAPFSVLGAVKPHCSAVVSNRDSRTPFSYWTSLLKCKSQVFGTWKSHLSQMPYIRDLWDVNSLFSLMSFFPSWGNSFLVQCILWVEVKEIRFKGQININYFQIESIITVIRAKNSRCKVFETGLGTHRYFYYI